MQSAFEISVNFFWL